MGEMTSPSSLEQMPPFLGLPALWLLSSRRPRLCVLFSGDAVCLGSTGGHRGRLCWWRCSGRAWAHSGADATSLLWNSPGPGDLVFRMHTQSQLVGMWHSVLLKGTNSDFSCLFLICTGLAKPCCLPAVSYKGAHC